MLTFDEVHEVNKSRAARWHEGFPDREIGEEWTLADWSNAMCGESGEAANIVKKIRRHDTDIKGGPNMAPTGPSHRDDLIEGLAKELADVVLYADLLATKAGIDLEEAVINKFNEVSEKRGYPERLVG